MLRFLLHRRAATACLALSLTMYACPETGSTTDDGEPVAVDDPAPPVEDAPMEEEAPDEPAPVASTTWNFTATVSNDHPAGEDLGLAAVNFCGGNSGAVIAGLVGGGIGSVLGVQLYLDANDNGVMDPDETPNPGTTTTIGQDGSFLLGAPLFQYGVHGIAALSIDGMLAPADLFAGQTFEVDAGEGEAGALSSEIFLDGFESGDVSAWTTCP